MMLDGEDSFQDSPKKAYKDCTALIKNLSHYKQTPKASLAEFIDLNKKQHYMPRRYDVSEMINNHHTIHEILEDDEAKIAMIDNKMSGLETEYIKKVKN